MQSPFMEAISCPANEKILQNLWILKVYYCVHTIQPLVSTLWQINSFPTLPSYFLQINFNAILTSMHI